MEELIGSYQKIRAHDAPGPVLQQRYVEVHEQTNRQTG